MVLSIFLWHHIVQWFMRVFTVIFWQPFFCDFPCFIQRSEQIKIEYFCTVCPVKALNENVLRRLTRQDKLWFYCVFLCRFSQCQGDKFLTIIHAQPDRIATFCRDPVEYVKDGWKVIHLYLHQRPNIGSFATWVEENGWNFLVNKDLSCFKLWATQCTLLRHF